MPQKNVVSRSGSWPFLDSVEIIESKYVDPLGNSKDAQEWRNLFINTEKFNDCLFGIVERYIIATKGIKGHRVAWVHRE
tara:strand:- start:809 stop:1045 length:237 start_codon:yes stop_codon:yes gene_type:complete